jgi:DNA-binding NtrC family response regulator
MNEQILIVDDEPLMCKSLGEVVRRAGYNVVTASNGYEALEYLQQEQVSVIITDMNMPKMDGIEVLKQAKAIIPNISVIIITGYATVDTAVEAMKYGAIDYITKPFPPTKINSIIEKAVNNYYAPHINISHDRPQIQKIISSNPQMIEILNKIDLIAKSDSNVLIQGESGTGKELIAKAIHLHSNRNNHSFVAVNCAAIPEGVLESELFGHEKGAFTGAISRRIGKFELAHNGTILLDEVSEMPKSFQAKLLRVIQEKEITRIGGNNQVKVDVRIIATTNRNILEEVDNGAFREDLFYRLCVIPVFIPPLRERKDDIVSLTNHFVKKSATKMRKDIPIISKDAIDVLLNYNWLGNVRELENTIERAVALCTNGNISKNDIILNQRKNTSKHTPIQVGRSLNDVEKELILKTLEEVKGNKQKAADILGITTKTIRNKLRQYGYEQDTEDDNS